jgi:hypothetical protein
MDNADTKKEKLKPVLGGCLQEVISKQLQRYMTLELAVHLQYPSP